MKGRFSMNFTPPTSNNRDNTHYPTHENQSVYRKGSAQYSTQQDVKRSFKTEPNYSQPSQNILVNDGLSIHSHQTNQRTHRGNEMIEWTLLFALNNCHRIEIISETYLKRSKFAQCHQFI